MTNPWSGRFTRSPAEDFLRFSQSLAEDREFLREDVAGSVAHVRALVRAGVLAPDEAERLAGGLRRVLCRLEAGEAHLKAELEDVHMNVEVLLRDEVGDLAGKLHTARSRNDQVALDLRLWTRGRALALAAALLDLADAALRQAERHADLPMPGHTHLQPAQPVTFGHWCHAHAERALRDAARALRAFDAANVSPLGAGALAGTSFPVDPAATAADLGMDAAFANSLDAVSDRDFALDATYAATVALTHLSGLSEELILYATPRYGWVRLPEAYTTGSSIMPQKRNPDAAELTRGRAGAVAGDLQSLLGTLKGLPLAYNRDLQEAKAPLLRALSSATAAVNVLADVIRGLEPVPERMAATLSEGHLEATEIADHLAARGVPFRDAHHLVGRLVAEADEAGASVGALPGLRDRHPALAGLPDDALDPARVPRRKATPGGTAPDRVREAVKEAAGRVDGLRAEVATRGEKVARVDTLLG